ncbi:MAG: hypothetical protein BWZ10_01154 [candidate division BRC1 bacterium ADurb.BinA364]|nr:MAG: hypothetical protein BWZ10_01154 [candidate division BRC1 bacterium ADurb.BinA364]
MGPRRQGLRRIAFDDKQHDPRSHVLSRAAATLRLLPRTPVDRGGHDSQSHFGHGGHFRARLRHPRRGASGLPFHAHALHCPAGLPHFGACGDGQPADRRQIRRHAARTQTGPDRPTRGHAEPGGRGGARDRSGNRQHPPPAAARPVDRHDDRARDIHDALFHLDRARNQHLAPAPSQRHAGAQGIAGPRPRLGAAAGSAQRLDGPRFPNTRRRISDRRRRPVRGQPNRGNASCRRLNRGGPGLVLLR